MKRKIFLIVLCSYIMIFTAACQKKHDTNDTTSTTIDTAKEFNSNGKTEEEIMEEAAGETEDENAAYMEGDSRLMNTWYDNAGNVLWHALTQEEVDNLAKKERERFEDWWKNYSESIFDVEEDTKLKIDLRGKSRREYLTSLCIEYNGLIPFSEGGREYSLGYDKYVEGFDNRYWLKKCGVSFGLDSEGYLIWIFRNTFGYTPLKMEKGIASLYTDCEQIIDVSSLQVGDICLLSNDPNASYNLFGVVAGERDGHVMVSLCDNTCCELFTNGCTRLAYISYDYNVAFGSSMPVDFKYFCRLDLDWEDKNE